MDLTKETLRRREVSATVSEQHALYACQLSKGHEEAGDYEEARVALEDFWPLGAPRPHTENLSTPAAAELLLRAGILTSSYGGSRQTVGSQESAKNLIHESLRAFESLRDTEKTHEARIELATCYWREGALDEARVILQGVVEEMRDEKSEFKAIALLRSAIVERSATRLNDALRHLTEAAPLFDGQSRDALKGKFHGQLALLYKNLGEAERREDYTDRALLEYAAASFHFEQAGHLRYSARVENNLGFLFAVNRRFPEAHQHLARARRLFSNLKDNSGVAQVDDTRARTFELEERYTEAERVGRAAVETLEKGDEQSLLAVALTTHGRVLAKLGKSSEACETLNRAHEVARRAGDIEGAGLAILTIIEELDADFTPEQLRALYEQADDLLARSQNAVVQKSLRACARKVVRAKRAEVKQQHEPTFVHAASRTGEILYEAQIIARGHGPVLLTGETGTGKEILARLIHRWSGREGRMLTINCAALNENLFESQVFGHTKGSFTGATGDQQGAAQAAAGGTLFLDEIAELSPTNQVKILGLIGSGEVRSIGSPVPEQLDLRIIAATNGDLRELVARGLFREDLFYRLQTFVIEIPPLRKRPEDIDALAVYLLDEACERHGKSVTFAPGAVERMQMLPLKGNARELQSLIERLLPATTDKSTITAEMVETLALGPQSKTVNPTRWQNFRLKDEVERFERRFIEQALKDAGGKVSHAARLLGYDHHESLNSLLKNRHRELLNARKPITPRRRSIICKHD